MVGCACVRGGSVFNIADLGTQIVKVVGVWGRPKDRDPFGCRSTTVATQNVLPKPV